jgi:hypothetical protein
VIVWIIKESGEPPRNRTENPQIKRRFDQEESLEILMISRVRYAEPGIDTQIDATLAQSNSPNQLVGQWRRIATVANLEDFKISISSRAFLRL